MVSATVGSLEAAFNNVPIILSAPTPERRSLDGLKKMLQLMPDFGRAKVPVNPCAREMTASGCKDAGCLRHFAESLSGPCAELLLAKGGEDETPEASPAPELSPADRYERDEISILDNVINSYTNKHAAAIPKTKSEKNEAQDTLWRKAHHGITAFMDHDAVKWVTDHRRRAIDAPSEGFWTVTSSDGEGHVTQRAGRGVPGPATLPPELEELMKLVPDALGLGGLFFEEEGKPEPSGGHDFGPDILSMIGGGGSAMPRRGGMGRTASIGGLSLQIEDKETGRNEMVHIEDPPPKRPFKHGPTASNGGVTELEFDQEEFDDQEDPGDEEEDEDDEDGEDDEEGGFGRTASIGGMSLEVVDEDPKAPKPVYPTVASKEVAKVANQALGTHPCAKEIYQCRDLTGSSTSGNVRACLLLSYDHLSPKCKCFVHQMEGPDKFTEALPAAARPAAQPRVSAVDIIKPAPFPPRSRPASAEEDDIIIVEPFPPPHHPRHGPPCFLMMLFAFLLTGLIVRRVIVCCCKPRTTFCAVVQPAQAATITSVEPLVIVKK